MLSKIYKDYFFISVKILHVNKFKSLTDWYISVPCRNQLMFNCKLSIPLSEFPVEFCNGGVAQKLLWYQTVKIITFQDPFFQDICKPTSYLHHLIPPARDTSVRRRFRIDAEIRCVGVHPPFGPLSRRGLNPIKPVDDPDWPDGRLNLTASAYKPTRSIYQQSWSQGLLLRRTRRFLP